MKKRFLSLIFSAVMVLLLAAPASAANNTANISIYGTENYDEIQQILLLVNKERTAEGLSPLTLDSTLTAYAMQRAAECAVNYSHTRPDGTSCFTIFEGKFLYGGGGENIAAGYTSAAAVHEGWMNSQGHRDNIMTSDFQSIGIGCFYQNGTKFWAQMFSTHSSTDVCKTYGTVQKKDIPITVIRDNISMCVTALDDCSGTALYQGTTVPAFVCMKNAGWKHASDVCLSGGYTLSVKSGGLTVSKNADLLHLTGVSAGTAQLKLVLNGGIETAIDVTIAPRPTLSYSDDGYGNTVVSWDDPLGVAQLFVKSGSNGEWTQLSWGSRTSCTHYGASADETYTYVLRAQAGDSEIEVSDPLIKRPEAPDVPVEPGAPGDLDGNGYLNEDDAIYLLQHVLMPTLFPVTQTTDFDGNSAVNEDDAIYLLQHILMPHLFPL